MAAVVGTVDDILTVFASPTSAQLHGHFRYSRRGSLKHRFQSYGTLDQPPTILLFLCGAPYHLQNAGLARPFWVGTACPMV
jgi:hypothetical protein